MSEREIFVKAQEIPNDAERRAYLGQACGGDVDLRRRIEELLSEHEQLGSFLEAPAFVVGESASSEDKLQASVAERPAAGAAGEQTQQAGDTGQGEVVLAGRYKLLQLLGEGGMGAVWMAQQTEPIKRVVAVKLIKAGMDSKQVLARFEAERQALAIMDHPNIAKVHDAGTTSDGRPFFVMELVKGVPITRYCDEHHLTPRQRLELFVPVCHAVQHAHQKGVIHRDLKPSNVLIGLVDGRPVPKVIDFGVAKAASQPLTERTLVTGLGTIVGTLEYMSPEQAELNNQDIDTRSDIYALGVLLYELLTGTTPLSRERLKQAAFTEMLRIIREEDPPRPSTRLSDSKDSLPGISAQRHTEPAKLTKLVRGELDWIVMKALEKDRRRRYETANGFAMDVQRYLADEAVQACPPSTAYRLRKFVRRNKVALATTAAVAVTLVLATVISIWQAIRATQAQAQAEVSRRHVIATLGYAGDAVRRMLTRVAEEDLAETPQGEGLRRKLHKDALEFNERFLADHGHDPDLKLEVAKTYLRMADTLGTKNAAAEKAARSGVAQLEALVAATPDNRALSAELVYAHIRLAYAAEKRGTSEWEQDIRKAVALADKLMAEEPDNRLFRHRRAECYFVLGHSLVYHRRQEAEAILRKAYDHAQADGVAYFVGRSSLGLADICSATDRLEEAERYLRTAADILPKSAENPRNGRRSEAEARNRLARVLAKLGRIEESDSQRSLALEIFAGLARDYPESTYHPESISMFGSEHGASLAARGRRDQAIVVYRQALQADVRVVSRKPLEPKHHNDLRSHFQQLDALLTQAGRTTDRAQIASEITSTYKALLAERPGDAVLRDEVERFEFQRRRARVEHGSSEEREQVAKEEIARLEKSDKTDAPARQELAFYWAALGDIRKDLNKHDLALTHYARAIELQPDSAGFLEKRGRLLDRLGQWDKAVLDYSRVIELEPKNALAWNMRGHAQVRMGAPDKALADLNQAITLEPARATHWVSRGNVHHALQQYDKAFQDYTTGIKLNKGNVSSWVWRSRAMIHARLHQWEDALADCNKGLERDPKYVPLLLERANCQVALKRYQAAGNDYQSAFEAAPKDRDAQNALARFLANCPDVKLRDPKRAVDLASSLVKLEPKQRAYWNTLGIARYRAEEWQPAIDTLQNSMKLGGGGNASDWFVLAMAHQKIGRKEPARQWYDRAVAWMEKNAKDNEELRRFRSEAEQVLEVKKKES
jgi:tetratricopeptide (TPR) repeat protein